MKSRFVITFFLLIFISIFFYYKYLHACSGCSAYAIGATGVAYGSVRWDCPGGKNPKCDCSGMLSRDLNLGDYMTTGWFYDHSDYTSVANSNFLWNWDPHVTVVNGPVGEGKCSISNCGSPCYNAEKTEYECETFYGEPRHTNF